MMLKKLKKLKKLKTPEMDVSRFDLVLFVAIGLIAAALAFVYVGEQRQQATAAQQAVIEKAEALQEARCVLALDRNRVWFDFFDSREEARLVPDDFQDKDVREALLVSNEAARSYEDAARLTLKEIATEACKDSLP